MTRPKRPKPAPGTTTPGVPPPKAERKRDGFTPEVMDKTIIALPLFEMMDKDQAKRQADPTHRVLYDVIIDVNLEYYSGREQARKRVLDLIDKIRNDMNISPTDERINKTKSDLSEQYLYGRLSAEVIQELARRDAQGESPPPGAATKSSPGAAPTSPAQTAGPGMGVKMSLRAIYHIWPDFKIGRLTTVSFSTVKADAARNAFSAVGEGIVWAVIDSGVDAKHPHFQAHRNLEVELPLKHTDFVSDGDAAQDLMGHGTHVAGIIAGAMVAGVTEFRQEGQEPGGDDAVKEPTYVTRRIEAVVRSRDEHNNIVPQKLTNFERISGMAPKCKILSLRVLDEHGVGQTSSVIAALEYIQKLNGNGRRLRVHGVNLSVGYTFEPEWFACGQSPLCVEVDRLVKSGVVVVVAAGNTGYGYLQSQALGQIGAGMELSINDPGNAELAITVGSTHREMPHVYGVSYFSSKGPTGDGRLKPDLVAPGEKIISCNIPDKDDPPDTPTSIVGRYKEDSGTSMAAPHVSGVIAGFLSVRREFIGRPEAVKEIFLSTATDLKRVPAFQGRGLVDMMRALQSI